MDPVLAPDEVVAPGISGSDLGLLPGRGASILDPIIIDDDDSITVGSLASNTLNRGTTPSQDRNQVALAFHPRASSPAVGPRNTNRRRQRSPSDSSSLTPAPKRRQARAHGSIHDREADAAYLRQVLAELLERQTVRAANSRPPHHQNNGTGMSLRSRSNSSVGIHVSDSEDNESESKDSEDEHMPRSHGKSNDEHMLNILKIVQQPHTGESGTEIEAILMTAAEAAKLFQSSSPDVPVVVTGGQTFEWDKGQRPIAEFFSRMGPHDSDTTASVQIPSRLDTEATAENKAIGEIRDRFLAENATDDPWNVLDLRNPLPPLCFPTFMSSPNCQLLHRIRDKLLGGPTVERLNVSATEANYWTNVLDWALLAEGGSTTTPHTDSHGFGTWISSQEGQFMFVWLSLPTAGELAGWMKRPTTYKGGRWRYIVLNPGQTVVFNNTVHAVCRARGGQTLSIGGHMLMWSHLQKWIWMVARQMDKPDITNEDMKGMAPAYVEAARDLVQARVDASELAELGEEVDAARFLKSAKVSHPPPSRAST